MAKHPLQFLEIPRRDPEKQPAAERVVQRGLACALVDKADSVLIDEAVTPLIISQAQENRLFTDVYHTAGNLAKSMVPGLVTSKVFRKMGRGALAS